MENQESDLIASFIRGEDLAFKEIHKMFFSRLVVFAYQLVADEKEAEDIVQDSLTKLFRIHRRFNAIAAIKAFLYIAVRNTSLNYLRYRMRLSENQKKYTAFLTGEKSISDQELMNVQLDGDLIASLSQSVQRLPPQSRKVIDLLYLEDLSYNEVAATLNISPKTVENIRAYALKLLRTDFRKKGLISEVFIILYFISRFYSHSLELISLFP